MKKTIALLLALTMMLALFASCNNEQVVATDTPEATTALSPQKTDAPSNVDDGTTDPAAPAGEGSYPAGDIAPLKLPLASDTLAVNADGTLKYELNDRSYPLDWYDYVLPLTTSQDTVTYMDFSWVPTNLVPSEGKELMDYYSMVRNKTGVNVAYQTFPGDFAAMQSAFAIALASDDLCDITAYGSLLYAMAGSGTQSDMIDQGWFANVADYRAYAPNYMFQVPRFNYDPDMLAIMWLNDEMMVHMGPMTENPMPSTGLCIRGDWLDRLDVKANDIRTYDQLLNVLTRFKNEIITNPDGYPMAFFASIELVSGMFFGGFDTGIVNTAPALQVVDKKVHFTMAEENDYEALQMFLKIQNEGLGDPNFAAYTVTADMTAISQADGLGIMSLYPGEVGGYEQNNITAGTRWDALHSPRLTSNQKLKYGHGQNAWDVSMYGWCYNAKSKNIPLLISYADYFYSEEGSWDGTWGIEGLTYEYDADGNPQRTDFVLNNEYGLSLAWFMIAYNQSKFTEPFRCMHLADYAYPGGERYRDFYFIWKEDYYTPSRDGVSEYDWPSATAKLTFEQQQETLTYLNDVNTWFAENYALFVDGSTPLTTETWSAYSTQLFELGYGRYRDAMQVALDDYLARRSTIISSTQG